MFHLHQFNRGIGNNLVIIFFRKTKGDMKAYHEIKILFLNYLPDNQLYVKRYITNHLRTLFGQ